VGFDELAELLLSVDVLTGIGVTSGVLALVWYLRRQWGVHREVQEREKLVEERRQREVSVRRDVDEWRERAPPSPEDWVRLPSPDIGLRTGDPIEYQGRNYWIKDIRQDFNPGGHYTYVRLEPFEKAEDAGKPRTRYERMLEDDY
jgi:hypothetical protein